MMPSIDMEITSEDIALTRAATNEQPWPVNRQMICGQYIKNIYAICGNWRRISLLITHVCAWHGKADDGHQHDQKPVCVRRCCIERLCCEWVDREAAYNHFRMLRLKNVVIIEPCEDYSPLLHPDRATTCTGIGALRT